MNRESLLLIIDRWKTEAYELYNQLEKTKNDYYNDYNYLSQKLNQYQYEINSIKNKNYSSIKKNENLLEQILINVDQSSISNKILVLSQFFVDSLKTLLLSTNIEEKQKSNIIYYTIIENIETNIKQIGNIIYKMNEDCSNQLIHNKNT
ncbi:unnamed protein product [Rotaria sp. Silwood1]|nr:unnamed protein product [Rotaria sp. Silwood1]CAF4922894.1 unnamed protein product [Rotaria sp. Silwood1]